MKTKVTCQCGAIYERHETKVMFRDKDEYSCVICGKELESWNGSRIPHFNLIHDPRKAPDKS